jgi:hypothetical protein
MADEIFASTTDLGALEKRVEDLENQLASTTSRNAGGISTSDFLTFTDGNLGVIASDNTYANITGTTSETTVATLIMPKNKIQKNGSFKIRVLWKATNTGGGVGTQIMRFKVNGTELIQYSRSSTSGSGIQITDMFFTNENSFSSQNWGYVWYKNDGAASAVAFSHDANGTALTASTINTEIDNTFTITGQNSDNAFDFWFYSASLEVYPKS